MSAISSSVQAKSDPSFNPHIFDAALTACRWEECDLFLVDTAKQVSVFVNEKREVLFSWPVSTSKHGNGQVEYTSQTPSGLHRIREKVGDGVNPYGMLTLPNQETEICRPTFAAPCEHLTLLDRPQIVGRILYLEGLEKGYNQGKNANGKSVDSGERLISIHGTNDLMHLGKPVTGGSIRLAPEAIVELFNRVSEKTRVYIA
jgi:lipoprotein-anchoring transpeptidase ErfK/SrfK